MKNPFEEHKEYLIVLIGIFGTGFLMTANSLLDSEGTAKVIRFILMSFCALAFGYFVFIYNLFFVKKD